MIATTPLENCTIAGTVVEADASIQVVHPHQATQALALLREKLDRRQRSRSANATSIASRFIVSLQRRRRPRGHAATCDARAGGRDFERRRYAGRVFAGRLSTASNRALERVHSAVRPAEAQVACLPANSSAKT